MKRIALTQGKFALVDDEDYCLAKKHKWYVTSGGYLLTRDSKIGRLHRYILELNGFNIKGKIIDHKNENKLDNRKSNLRFCNKSENGANSTKRLSLSKSGYKGVYFSQNKWMAKITKNYNDIFIGRYDTKEKAALAYNKKAKELFGEFAMLNKV